MTIVFLASFVGLAFAIVAQEIARLRGGGPAIRMATFMITFAVIYAGMLLAWNTGGNP